MSARTASPRGDRNDPDPDLSAVDHDPDLSAILDEVALEIERAWDRAERTSFLGLSPGLVSAVAQAKAREIAHGQILRLLGLEILEVDTVGPKGFIIG
jgi:hypothetical protein